MHAVPIVAGIFVGGRSSRMGRPKGLLTPPDQSAPTLVERLAAVIEEADVVEEIVLVGRRPEYAHLPWLCLSDAAVEAGPLGGLVALMGHAGPRRRVLAVGCDFPYLQAPLVRRLASFAPRSSIVAPYEEGRFQPLCARYGGDLLPAFGDALDAGRLALQPLLRKHGAAKLPVAAEESQQLRDWDTPDDTWGVII